MEIDTSTERSLVGTTLDNRYRIDEVIGQGGMSTVYKATHLFLKRVVAIKVMQDHLLGNSEGRLRFEREAQAAASLSHRNIIGIQEFGVSEDGEPFMVMDYVEGESLADLLRQRLRARSTEALVIFQQVAAALQHAHEKGVLHRDLKPSNVMLVTERDNSLSTRVVDFGLARFLPSAGRDGENQRRLTAAGELVGSPYYMSPEQIRDDELDARSDIYSLGCLMYEALTGCRPFTDTNAITVLSMHLYEDPAPFSLVLKPNRIPAQMESIVNKCLQKSRKLRYQSMADLAGELAKITPWADGAAESTPINLSSGAPYTAPKVRMYDTKSGGEARSSSSGDSPAPDLHPKTNSWNSAPQYTLKLEKPNFTDKPAPGLLTRLAQPFMKLFGKQYRTVVDSFEGKGVEARRQRLSGTRVLVAVLDESQEMFADAYMDASKYNIYYKHVNQRKGLTAQEFLVLLSTDQFEIVHLHGSFDRNAIFTDSTGFSLRLSDVQRACRFAGVKLLWLASNNKVDWLNDSPLLADPPFHMVLTETRGQHFAKFLSTLLSRMARGETITNAWFQVVPTLQSQGQKVDLRLIPATADVTFLP